MQDISGFGTKATLIFSNSFPVGMTITQASDDADFVDIPAVTIGEGKMGLNGDLITWAVANGIAFDINVIPNSADDLNLSAAYENNRVGKGKISTRDVVTLIIFYPDGSTVTLTSGKMLVGMPGNSIASAGRMKTKKYSFIFENKISTPAV